jgi:hypothetical protein
VSSEPRTLDYILLGNKTNKGEMRNVTKYRVCIIWRRTRLGRLASKSTFAASRSENPCYPFKGKICGRSWKDNIKTDGVQTGCVCVCEPYVSLRRCPVQRFCKTGNVPSDSTEDGKFLHDLTGYFLVSWVSEGNPDSYVFVSSVAGTRYKAAYWSRNVIRYVYESIMWWTHW